MSDILDDNLLSSEKEKNYLKQEINTSEEYLFKQKNEFAKNIINIGSEIKEKLNENKKENKTKSFFKKLFDICQ